MLDFDPINANPPCQLRAEKDEFPERCHPADYVIGLGLCLNVQNQFLPGSFAYTQW